MKKGSHKITIDDLKTILDMYYRGMNHTEISKEFTSTRHKKVSRRHISAILGGKRWKQEILQLLNDSK
jgi:hypothetical protein